MLLVSVTDEGSGSGKGKVVTISASVPGAEVIVENQSITPGQVAEVIVIPQEISPIDNNGDNSRKIVLNEREIIPDEPYEAPTEETLEGTIYGERSGLKEEEHITINVLGGEDFATEFAVEMRDKFIPWLATNHPEFGITSETEWVGTIVRPHIMVVAFYLFFSEEWEMGVTWHVTRAPDNWTRIYLRRRYTEVYPSYGFEISSWSTEGEEPHIIDPENPQYFMSEIWR